jgi:hypothetical protein
LIGQVESKNGKVQFYPNELTENMFTAKINTGEVTLTAEMTIFENVNELSTFYIENDGELVVYPANLYKKITPTEYQVAFLEQKERILIFSETYSPNWVATVGDEKIEPMNYEGVTAFKIKKEHNIINIHYESQSIQNIGYVVSIATLIVLIFLSIRKKLRLKMKLFR